jgi:hypothetical protein
MIPARLASLLSIASPLAPFSPVSIQEAKAQTDAGGVGAVAAAPPGDQVQDGEIVVAGRRHGEAEVDAETEFDEAEIGARGAYSIDELLRDLGPVIGGADDEPVILVNGQDVGFDRSILSYPPEALSRLAVLKPEAASRYGHPSGKRVLNLVLKKRFASLDAEAGASGATAGGQSGGSLSVRRVAIIGSTRWHAQGRVDRDSALLRSARDLTPRAGPVDGVGDVAAPDGGEIDPALSAAAGEPVTAAAFPASAQTAFPSLQDFAATANGVNAVDPDDFETLLPSRRTLSFTAGATRPIGAFSASLSVNAGSNASAALRGLPMASAVLPSGSSWSPFAGDVRLIRPFAGTRPLRADNVSTTIGTAFTLAGRLGGWQTSFSANYSKGWTENRLENGIDLGRLQAAVDARDAAFNPDAPLDRRLLSADDIDTRSDSLNARIHAARTLADLPAGPLTSSMSADIRRSHVENRRREGSGLPFLVERRNRGQANGQLSFGIPLARRGEDANQPLGDLAVDLTLGADTQSDIGLQKRFQGGLTWSPAPIVQLRGALEIAETAPSIDQLDGPLVTAIARVFDFRRQEVVDAVRITGGNPELARGRRRVLSLTARILPFGNPALALNVGYRGQVARGGAGSLPDLTPAVEAAFPGRVVRDADGRLQTIDARPINIVRDADADLTSSITLRLPAPDDAGERRPPASGSPVKWSLSLTHSWRLESELLTGAGLPVIDRLSDDGGQSRHSLQLQLTLGGKGFGATVNGSWNSPARIRNATPADGERSFRIRPSPIFNLSLFFDLDRHLSGKGRMSWLSDTRMSLDIQNLFDGYRRVTFDDGSTPPGFGRDDVDPLGRTLMISVRKRF